MTAAPRALPEWWARSLTVLGAMLVVVALPGVWLDRQVLDTDRYTATVAPLIDDPAVQERVADRLTEVVVTRSGGLDLLGQALAPLIRDAVETEAFADAWEDAVRFSHDQLLAAVRGESGSLAFEGTTLYADLGRLTDSLRTWLVEQGLPRAASIPDVEGSIVLVDVPRLPQAQLTLAFADRALMFLGIGAALLLAGVLLSPSPRRGLVLGGAVVAVGSLVVLATDLVVRSDYLSAVPDTVVSGESARLVYDALTSPIRTAELWTALVALGITTAAAVWPLLRRTGRGGTR